MMCRLGEVIMNKDIEKLLKGCGDCYIKDVDGDRSPFIHITLARAAIVEAYNIGKDESKGKVKSNSK